LVRLPSGSLLFTELPRRRVFPETGLPAQAVLENQEIKELPPTATYKSPDYAKKKDISLRADQLAKRARSVVLPVPSYTQPRRYLLI
jgi:hypothetical protein